MSDPRNTSNGRARRPAKNTFVTKSGKSIRVNQSLSQKRLATREARAERKAAYLSSLPKERWKRLLYRMHPKRVIQYWFSREGAIMALKLTGVGIVVMFLLIVGVFAYFRKDLPKIKDISGDQGGSITYYDRTGSTVLWQDYDAVKRIPVTQDQISKYMQQATVAIEDKDFYKHGAFDVRGIARAGVNNIRSSGGGVQGGSTITQQLVKLNQDWTNDRTVSRKIKEIILAVDLERQYTKDDILTGYLNVAPYGGVEYGVQSASRDYFNKDAKDLTLAEAATLAAIPKSPSLYYKFSPYFDAKSLTARVNYILDQMTKQGYITKDQAAAAKKQDVIAAIQPLQPKYNGIKAPYFVLAAKSELEQKYGTSTVNRGGWKVTTSLDMDLQAIADQEVQKNRPILTRNKADQQAFVAEDVPTGQIVALVGGTDFNDPEAGEINYAQRKIPPGSSFKPYDYAALINYSQNVGAGSVLYDSQGALPGYSCTNKNSPKSDKKANCLWDYDLGFPGPVTLRYALGGSRNVPAVKAMLTVGTDKTIKTATDLMGVKDGYQCYAQGDVSLTDEAPCYGSAAIGDGAYLHLDQHVNGLASLSRMGVSIPRTYIMNISDSNNKTIYKWTQPQGKQVIKPDAAFIVNDMLSDGNASYLPASYKFQNYKGWKFAVKTGTTNDNYDGLMTSWSTRYAVATWVGYHTRTKELGPASMEIMTEPVVKAWMRAAHDKAGGTPVNWTPPTGVTKQPAFVITKKVSRLGEVIPSPATDYYPSWYKPSVKTANVSQTIDKVSKKLATSCTPELAKDTQNTSNTTAFSVDNFVNGGTSAGASGAITETDDVHKCGDAPPSAIVTAPSACKIEKECTITVTVQAGAHSLSSNDFPGQIKLLVNGTESGTATIAPADAGSGVYTTSFKFTPTQPNDNTAITVQVVDSVLLSVTSSAATIKVTD